MHCVGEIIKTINIKYTIIFSQFILTILLSIFIQDSYIQLFASPIILLTIHKLFQSEYEASPPDLTEEKIKLSVKVMMIAVVTQFVLNVVSILILKPFDTSLAVSSAVIPVVSLYTVLTAPLVEEFIFRRIIFGSLQRNKEKFSVIAAIISSILFATIHMSVTLYLGYFAIGMIFCYYYYLTKKLQTVILAHMFFNFYAIFGTSIKMVFGGN